MRRIGGIDHVDRVDAARIFLADALKHALGPGSLDPRRNAGIFGLERLGDLLGQRKIDRRVPDDLAFAPGGFDQLGGDGRWFGRRRLDRRRERRRGQRTGSLQHCAPGHPLRHHVSSLLDWPRSRDYLCNARQRSERHMQPDLGALRDILARRGHDAQLRTVGELHHIVPACAKKDVAHHGRRQDILRIRRLRCQKTQVVLPDCNRALAARRQARTRAAQRNPGNRDASVADTRTFDDVARPQEACNELRVRRIVDVLRRTEPAPRAPLHHRDLVGGGHGLGLIVRHIDRGVSVLVMQAADLEAHFLAQVGIEVRQRLVEQQHLRLDHQRTRQGDALLLPARQLARIAVGKRRQAGSRQDGIDASWRWSSDRACARCRP